MLLDACFARGIFCDHINADADINTEPLMYDKQSKSCGNYGLGCLSIAIKKYEYDLYDPRKFSPEYSGIDIIEAERKIIFIAPDILGAITVFDCARYIIYNIGSTKNKTINKSTERASDISIALCSCYATFENTIPLTVVSTAIVQCAYDIMFDVGEIYRSVVVTTFGISPTIIANAQAEIMRRAGMLYDERRLSASLSGNIIGCRIWDIIRGYYDKFNTQLRVFGHGLRDTIYNNVQYYSHNYTQYYGKHPQVFSVLPANVKNKTYINCGGFGDVSKITINGTNISIALKKFKDEASGCCISFVREIATYATLRSHKNILTMYGIACESSSCDFSGSDDSPSDSSPSDCSPKYGIYLELMECDLAQYYAKNDTSFAEIQNYCLDELRSGLFYMHSLGILHRDIKPNNILTRGNWPYLEIKYCDFGSSKGSGLVFSDAIGQNPWTLNENPQFFTDHTRNTTTVGYNAPELTLNCGNYGFAIDYWSLACTLAEFVHKKKLFGTRNLCDVLELNVMLVGTPSESDWPQITNILSINGYSKMPHYNRGKLPMNVASERLNNAIWSGLTMNPRNRRI
jgi:hypothetical protein